MFKFAPDFWKSKATWTAIAAIITAIVAAWNKTITWPAAITAIFAAAQTAWMRDALSKSTNTPTG